MNSLRRFLIHEVVAKQQRGLEGPSAEDIKDEIEINRQWNSEIAQMRQTRILLVKEDRKEQIMLSLERQREINNERLNILSEKVKKIEEESKSFITRELLDQSIEHALANPVNFDSCIDSKGKPFLAMENNEK